MAIFDPKPRALVDLDRKLADVEATKQAKREEQRDLTRALAKNMGDLADLDIVTDGLLAERSAVRAKLRGVRGA